MGMAEKWIVRAIIVTAPHKKTNIKSETALCVLKTLEETQEILIQEKNNSLYRKKEKNKK